MNQKLCACVPLPFSNVIMKVPMPPNSGGHISTQILLGNWGRRRRSEGVNTAASSVTQNEDSGTGESLFCKWSRFQNGIHALCWELDTGGWWWRWHHDGALTMDTVEHWCWCLQPAQWGVITRVIITGHLATRAVNQPSRISQSAQRRPLLVESA